MSERRLRIAFVVHDYHRRGGHSRYVAELASRFQREHDVHVFANTVEEPNPGRTCFHHVPAWRTNALASVLSFALPATCLVRGRFNVIHGQGFCGLRQNVVTAHICQGAWHEAQARSAGRASWRKRLFHAVASRCERWTYRAGSARRVIAVSERTRADLRTHYCRADGVRVIYHGVDTETFHPRNRFRWRDVVRRQLGIAAQAVVALYVGDLQKGLPAALAAVGRVPGLHLVAVSPSPATQYAAAVAALGLSERVHLLPATAHVERYFAAADLFLFPTFYDSFGMVVTEAMASGLPVICSAAAGAAELIDDGVQGMLVQDAWDPESLAMAVQRLADDPDLRRRLGDAARRRIEPFTWDEAARQTMSVYQEIA